MIFAGYPMRGNPILGKVRGISGEDRRRSEFAVDKLGLPYTTLGYANGPGYVGAAQPRPRRTSPDLEPTSDYREATSTTCRKRWCRWRTKPTAATMSASGRSGPGSDAVRGSVEQNAIFHFLVQATPALRERLCAANTCNADGVPVESAEARRLQSAVRRR